jgi:hypothetical protein
VLAALFFLAFTLQSPTPACADASSCRAAALEAQTRKDFERFHDLAWMAYRKSRADDAEAMLLLARAQSLSGRPGDALVMLNRLGARGVATDAATSEDFAGVRALPAWSGEKPATAPSPSTAPAVADKPPAVSPADPIEKSADPPPTSPRSKASVKSVPPSAKPLEKTPVEKTPADPPATPNPSSVPTASPRREPGAPLKFATVLTPTALAYDAVSRRYIIADRAARRIAVIDENTGQVATLVGAQGALGDIGGIAIDAQQGDLWVVASEGDELTLHRMQLISGRLLSSSTMKGVTGPVVAVTFARHVGVILSDAAGIIWRVRANGRSDKLAALEYVPRALATDADGRLYVAGGGPRLARFALEPSMRKIDVVELAPGVPPDAPFTVLGGGVGIVVPTERGYEIRTVPLRRR